MDSSVAAIVTTVELDPKNAAAMPEAFLLPCQKFAGIGIHQRPLDYLLFSSNYFSETPI